MRNRLKNKDYTVPEKPGYVPQMPKSKKHVYNKDYIAKIFDLWKQRSIESPESFDDSDEDYGQRCAAYFQQLSDEINDMED